MCKDLPFTPLFPFLHNHKHTHTHLHGQRSEGCCFTLFHAILSRAVSQYELTRAPKLRSVWSRAHSTKQGATFRSIHTSSFSLVLFSFQRDSQFSSHEKKISSRRGKQMFSPSLTPKSRFTIVAAAAAVTNTREKVAPLTHVFFYLCTLVNRTVYVCIAWHTTTNVSLINFGSGLIVLREGTLIRYCCNVQRPQLPL